MNRSIGALYTFALAFALAAAGCAAETTTGSDNDQTGDARRSQMVQADNPHSGSSATPGEQQTNFNLRPDSEVSGPIPDPWIGAGPIPDPWNPGNPGQPKARLVPRDTGGGTGDDLTPSGNHK